MKKQQHISILIILTLCIKLSLFAQYPQYFSYDGENGLPSNEVYSIIQDKKGFIWIGCDAGLFKFDGVRYTSYKCKTQKSKSITGLTLSSSGKLYCYNFQSQLFCLENDPSTSSGQALKELNHTLPKGVINNLVSDKDENIYVTHIGGISRYNEKNKLWNNYLDYGDIEKYGNEQWVTKSVQGNEHNVISCIYSKGIAIIENNKLKQIYNTNLFSKYSSGKFEIETHQNSLWIFSKETNTIYRFANNKLEQIAHLKLNDILAGRKITSVNALSDSCLWICTYKGIVRYFPQKDSASLFYPDLSFSDCLIDQEENYWFTTLQEGILRIPNLNFTVWNQYNKLTRIINSRSHIFFADQKGKIGKINLHNGITELFHTKFDADVQSFDYDVLENALLFNINNHLFQLKKNTLNEKNNFGIYAIKSVRNIDNSVFTTSSHGVFINEKQVSQNWARQIKHDTVNQYVWIATNGGLLKFMHKNKEWYLSDTLFIDKQILSVDFAENLLYALNSLGKFFSVNNQNKIVEIAQIPENIQVNKIISHNQKLYISSNAGVAVFDKQTEGLYFVNRFWGLISDNVQDITIADNCLWLATVKGLQQIPLNKLAQQKPLAKIYLKNFESSTINPELKYNEALILNPEVVHYSSNGQFEYAYRINRQDWIKLPATIEQIEIQNIPTGNFEIELKAIDCFGNDSENIILLKGYVNSPFWLTWWFVALIVLFLAIVIFVAVKKRIKLLKQKQQQELERIQLENDLVLSRETALKSQMNPHFVFNVLNSIKSYIYKNDKQKASDYLNKFSDLIRTFLSMSNKPSISIADELKMLELYIAMEAMLLKDDFSFVKHIDTEIDLQQTKIPSLIIQPFIENAFKHGLHNKANDKKLTLSVQKTEQNFIIIEISDNGIGRAAAQKIKETQHKHESFATTAIEKRIELLNKNQQTVSVSINDLFDEHNKPSGTSVTLKIMINIE